MTCKRKFKRGWVCTRCPRHDGPCALRPAWWNIVDRIIWGLIR